MSGAIVKLKSRGTQKPPLIIVVSKAVSKKATERNLLKRRVRSILRGLLKDRKSDLTIILKKEALQASFQKLKEEILNKL